MKTVYDLMREVACKLAGKPVRLRFHHNEGAYGICRADSSGITTIDIEPELQFSSEHEFLEVFLHEISHAKNHKYIPMELEVSDRIEVKKDKAYNMREAQADSESEAWLKYAEQNRNKEEPYFQLMF